MDASSNDCYGHRPATYTGVSLGTPPATTSTKLPANLCNNDDDPFCRQQGLSAPQSCGCELFCYLQTYATTTTPFAGSRGCLFSPVLWVRVLLLPTNLSSDDDPFCYLPTYPTTTTPFAGSRGCLLPSPVGASPFATYQPIQQRRPLPFATYQPIQQQRRPLLQVRVLI